ncbi:MAG: DUF3106 domain-containing protein [Thermomonas sp.]
MNAIRLLLLVLLSASLSTNAQQASAALPAWDQLSDAQRTELVAPLRDHWDRAPEERAHMLERAQRWRSMSPAERKDADRGMRRWERMDPARRAQMQVLFEKTRDMPPPQRRATFALFRALLPLDAEHREALLKQWKAMTPAQRDAWLDAQQPPHRGPGPKHGPGPGPDDD